MAVKEVQSGELFKFEKIKDSLGGKLLSYEERADSGKGIGHVYEIENENGIVPFFASSDLQKKLRNIPLGSAVHMELKEKTKTKAGNDYKIYSVRYGSYNEADCKDLGIVFSADMASVKTVEDVYDEM